MHRGHCDRLRREHGHPRHAAAIYDLDNTPASRELLSRFSGNGYFSVVAHVNNDREMDDL